MLYGSLLIEIASTLKMILGSNLQINVYRLLPRIFKLRSRNNSRTSLCVEGGLRKMAKKIVIPFPVWDFLYEKQEEIAKLLNEKFDVEWAPSKTPRSIEFKQVKPAEGECDRLKIKLWYPRGVYVTAVIGGWDSSYSVGWSLVAYKAKWTFYGEEGRVSCSIDAEGAAAQALEAAAHCYLDLVSNVGVRESDVQAQIDEFKSFNALKIEA